MSDYQDIIYTVADRIATIAFNRPQVHNAMSRRLRVEAVDALKRAEADDSVSVIVICGEGKSFCSGYDIGAQEYDGKAHAVSELMDDWTDQLNRQILRDWYTIWDLLKPVVAKVHGNCLAGGTEVMSICDIAFSTDEARIGYPPTRAQATPDLSFFPWKLPMSRAKYMQMTGNIITGKQAADWGWVTKSFPEAEFEEAFTREITALASIAPDMLVAQKFALNQQYEIMGFKNALNAAVPWHHFSARIRPNAGEFRRIANEAGLKTAVNWRDEPFRDLDAPSRRSEQKQDPAP